MYSTYKPAPKKRAHVIFKKEKQKKKKKERKKETCATECTCLENSSDQHHTDSKN